MKFLGAGVFLLIFSRDIEIGERDVRVLNFHFTIICLYKKWGFKQARAFYHSKTFKNLFIYYYIVYFQKKGKMLQIIDFALILQLFILINPLSSFPVLMSAYRSKMNVRKIAISASIVAFVVAIIIAITGPYLFNLFGVSVDSFRVAGGIVLLLLGLDTIRKKEENEKGIGKTDSLISIIATPLLTGPATISFITVKAYEIGRVPILMDIFLAFIIVAIVFILFSLFVSKMNPKVIGIFSKVLGLFLTAVAIEMIAKGVQGLISTGIA
jgi:multiple antibiotic resistance protein